MRIEIIIIFLIVTIIFIFAILLSYTPIYKLTKRQREHIKKVGFNHFTDYSAANSIVKEGFVCKPADMGFPTSLLGKMVWLYIGNENFIPMQLAILLKKKKAKDNPDNFKYCVHASNISEKDLDRMRIRHGFCGDCAIVYLGDTFKPGKMEIIETESI